MSEHEPARRTDFYWQGMRLCGERSSLQAQSWYFYHEGGYTPLARYDCGEGDEGTLLFMHAEANGMPLLMSNGEGETVWQAEETTLYGRITREKSALSPYVAQQHLRFAGQYHDKETGLHYNTLRYYDPDAGRFTQPDPTGLAGGLICMRTGRIRWGGLTRLG
ncbi:RHS repeat-associated core domain-containing protein [Serratia proteamaculans]